MSDERAWNVTYTGPGELLWEITHSESLFVLQLQKGALLPLLISLSESEPEEQPQTLMFQDGTMLIKKNGLLSVLTSDAWINDQASYGDVVSTCRELALAVAMLLEKG